MLCSNIVLAIIVVETAGDCPCFVLLKIRIRVEKVYGISTHLLFTSFTAPVLSRPGQSFSLRNVKTRQSFNQLAYILKKKEQSEYGPTFLCYHLSSGNDHPTWLLSMHYAVIVRLF